MKKTLRSLLMTALLLSVARSSTAKDKAPRGRRAGRRSQAGHRGLDRRLRQGDGRRRLHRAAGPAATGSKSKPKAMITLFTQGKGLNGLDTKRPWGVVVNTDGGGFQPLGFLPVTDLEQAARRHWRVDRAGRARKPDGILEIQQSNQTLVPEGEKGLGLHQPKRRAPGQPAGRSDAVAGWIGQAISNRREVLCPQHSRNVPLDWRSTISRQLSQTLPVQEDEDEAAAEKRQELLDKQAKSLAELINTVDQFTLGWALDTNRPTRAIWTRR